METTCRSLVWICVFSEIHLKQRIFTRCVLLFRIKREVLVVRLANADSKLWFFLRKKCDNIFACLLTSSMCENRKKKKSATYVLKVRWVFLPSENKTCQITKQMSSTGLVAATNVRVRGGACDNGTRMLKSAPNLQLLSSPHVTSHSMQWIPVSNSERQTQIVTSRSMSRVVVSLTVGGFLFGQRCPRSSASQSISWLSPPGGSFISSDGSIFTCFPVLEMADFRQ